MPHPWLGRPYDKKKRRRKPIEPRTFGPIPITSKREHEIYRTINYTPERPVPPATEITVNIGKNSKKPIQQEPKLELETQTTTEPNVLSYHNNNGRPKVINDALSNVGIS